MGANGLGAADEEGGRRRDRALPRSSPADAARLGTRVRAAYIEICQSRVCCRSSAMARRPARRPARKSARATPRTQRTRSSRSGHRTRQNHRGLAGAPCRQAVRDDRPCRCRQPKPAFRWRSCAAEFASTLAIVAAHIKATDRAVLAADLSDMAEEPARERLFDVLMRRLEILAPHREAVRSLLRSARRNPPLALALNGTRGALAAMDADRRRHRAVGPARHDARARPGDAVRVGAAHLDRR